ncbi:TPA: G5 domain-containing protein [Streptococcus suis]|nr:G5 domain-containing protein [Streptococcus suis]
MSRFFYEKRKAFSIRKLSVGVLSLCIANFALVPLLATPQVLANEIQSERDLKQIQFRYVLDSELNRKDLERLVKVLPAKVSQDVTYYLVYQVERPAILPATGQIASQLGLVLAGGFLLVGLVASRSKKARVVCLLYVTIGGAVFPVLELAALESSVLASHNQTITLAVGDSLPDGKIQIAGHRFLGYLVDGEKAELTQKKAEVAGRTNSASQGEQESLSQKNEKDFLHEDKEIEQVTQPEILPEIRYREEVEVLPAPVEEREDPNLVVGESRMEEGQDGQRTYHYKETWVNNHLVQTDILDIQETPARPQILYKGSKAVENQDQVETISWSLGEESLNYKVVPLAFDLQQRTERQDLAIAEVEIRTDRLLVGETERQPGQAGQLIIDYQDVVVAGQVVASKELGRQEIAGKPSILYIGTREEGTALPEQLQEEVTQVPDQAPQQIPPAALEFELVNRTASEDLPIVVERVETDRLPSGETEIEEGQAGRIEIDYQDVVVAGQVVASNELSRREFPGRPSIHYIGIGETEEIVSSEAIVQVPDYAPSRPALPSLPIQELSRSEEISLEIPEERISTQDLARGQTRVEEGRAGKHIIQYKDTFVDGKLISSQETSREEIPSISRKIFEGIGIDEKLVAPLYQSDKPVAQIERVEEFVSHGFREEINADLRQDEVVVLPGRNGLKEVTYARISDQRTVLTSRVLEEAQDQVTVRGSRQDGKLVAPLYQADKPVAKIRYQIEQVPFSHREEERPEWLEGRIEMQEGQTGENRLTYFDIGDQSHLVKRGVIREARDQITYRGSKVVELPTPPSPALEEFGPKPTLSLRLTQTDKEGKSVSLAYLLEDKAKRFQSARASLYIGDTLVETKELKVQGLFRQVTFSQLQENIDYTVRAEITYRAGEQELTDSVADEANVTLETRRIQFKHTDRPELWQFTNGQATRILQLNEIPQETSSYYIKLVSEEAKEVLLPVASIQTQDAAHFRVRARLDNLVEDKQANGQFSNDLTFDIPRNTPVRTGSYRDFAQLVQAMNQNLTGEFHLAGDMTASGFQTSVGQTAYVLGEFKGRLVGNGYSIYDLSLPFLEKLGAGARVQDLHLKEVAIHQPQASHVGALAKESYAQDVEVSDVAVQGQLTAADNIGGLVGHFAGGRLADVSFKGSIRSLTTANTDNRLGGIAAWLGGSGQIDGAVTDAQLMAISSGSKIGGIVGQVEGASSIRRVFASGLITSSASADTENGGLVGTILSSAGRISRISLGLSTVQVTEGKPVYGFPLDNQSQLSQLYYLSEGESSDSDRHAQAIESEQVEQLLAQFDLPQLRERIQTSATSQEVYQAFAHYRPSRLQAYRNMEKLLPFYTRDVLIQQANRLEDGDSLVTKQLLDVQALSGQELVFYITTEKPVTGLLLHYADGSSEQVYLNKRSDLVVNGGAIQEYILLDRNISYTPDNYAFSPRQSQAVNSLIAELTAVQFDSQEIRQALGIQTQNNLDLAKLFLEESFNQVKSDVERHLIDLLSSNWLFLDTNSAGFASLMEEIRTNKAAFLLGLAYMNRWYAITFGERQVKDLMIKEGSFFGRNQNSLDRLIQLGNLGKAALQPKYNYVIGSGLVAGPSLQSDLFGYLEALRQVFSPDKTTSQWFNESSKAFILETKSEVASARAKQDNPTSPYHHVEVYKKISSRPWRFKEMALILLTMPGEGIFVVSNMTSLFLGMYEHSVKEWTPAEYEKVKERVRAAAKHWNAHSDYLYNILPESHKDKIFSHVINWDSRLLKGRWLSLLDPTPSMRYFFGPLGKDHTHYEGTFAYSLGYDNVFDCLDMMGERAASTYTHELTHVLEDDVYLLGHSRRNGMSPEVFAEGLFQSNPWSDQDRLTINSLFDHSDKESFKRLTNLSPQRFQSTEDLQTYLRGYFDVLYSLDYLEAEAVLKQSSYVRQNWFNQLVTLDDNGILIRKLPYETSISSFEELIDKGLVSRRFYDPEGKSDSIQYPASQYHSISALDPMYGALNDDGPSRNEMHFRKLAFEFLAEYGYEDGLVAYASNKFRSELGYRSADSQVIAKMSDGEFDSAAAFRKAMFRRRIEKLNQLKPITIRGRADGGYFHGPTRTISSLQELKELMAKAVDHDASWQQYYSQYDYFSKEKSQVYGLKAALLNAFLLETEDFKQSIYRP